MRDALPPIHLSANGYLHVFEDLIEACAVTLAELGYAVTVEAGRLRDDALNLVVGGLYPPEALAPHRGRLILYNLEQVFPQSLHMTRRHFRALKQGFVWDYSAHNLARLASAGIGASCHVPIAYCPALTRIAPAPVQDIDVLFYGSINERRRNAIEAVRRAGLNVVTNENAVWPRETRDAHIARAKVVLNLHYYEIEQPILEIARLSYLWSNRKAVVAEIGPGTVAEDASAEAVLHGTIGTLPALCRALVDDETRRRALEEGAFATFSRHSMGDALRAGLAAWQAWRDGAHPPSPVAVPVAPAGPGRPRVLQIGSGKKWRYDVVNLDVREDVQPDIVADLCRELPFGMPLPSWRFGEMVVEEESFDHILAEDVFEHLPDLVTAVTNCLRLLKEGGVLEVAVPYDLSYGAWQDPTHVRAFNENSWRYYTDWYWYLGWTEWRFDLVKLYFSIEPTNAFGLETLRRLNNDWSAVVRIPRAVDAIRVTLRKRRVTAEEKAANAVYVGN